MQEEKIRIVVTDDHELVRKGFISLLNDQVDMRVVGDVGNGKELLDLLKIKPTDVVLLDLEMPHMSGEEALKIIVQRFSGVKVIILSAFLEPSLVPYYLSLGAYACLDKNCKEETLLKAIRKVRNNEPFFDNIPQATLINEVKNIQSPGNKKSLTKREIEVVKLICLGKKNKEIAKSLNMALSTVDFHRGNIYNKTQTGNSAALAVYAIKHGILVL